MRVLIEAGADVSARDDDDMPLIIGACAVASLDALMVTLGSKSCVRYVFFWIWPVCLVPAGLCAALTPR